MNPITNIVLMEDEDKIIITCEKNKIIVTAEADCCSVSWIELLPDTNIMDCIGKTYICCIEVDGNVELPDSMQQEYDSNHLFEFQFTDGTTFPFYMRNSSNGYYDGEIIVSFVNTDGTDGTNNTVLQEYNEGQIIIIVGLPGSGKSTYVNEQIKRINDYLFDDTELFLDSTYSELKQLLEQGQTIIIVSAKLCEPLKYTQFVNSLNILNPEQAIETYCFTHDVPNSTQNIRSREQKKTNQFITSLTTLSTVYDPNSDVYINKRIIPTYQKL